MNPLKACAVQEPVSRRELDILGALPDAAHQVNFTVLSCELETGHAGAHLALGQAYGPRERWLQWKSNGQHDWLDIADDEHCIAEGAPVFEDGPEDPQLCLFPDDHPGGHSFEIA
jgi:hypothetical protein